MGQMSHHVMLQRKNIKYLTADFLYWGKILFFFVNGDLCMFVGVYLYIKNTIYCAWRCRIMGKKVKTCWSASQTSCFIYFPHHTRFSVSASRLQPAEDIFFSASRFIVTDGQIEDMSEVRLQKSYLVSSGQRSRSPVCSNYPSVGCMGEGNGPSKLAGVDRSQMWTKNWYRWKYGGGGDGGGGGGGAGRLIGEEETFPEKTIKLIDDFPGGMFPQVCSVRTCVRTRNAILGRGTSTIRKNWGLEKHVYVSISRFGSFHLETPEDWVSRDGGGTNFVPFIEWCQ